MYRFVYATAEAKILRRPDQFLPILGRPAEQFEGVKSYLWSPLPNPRCYAQPLIWSPDYASMKKARSLLTVDAECPF